MATKCIVLGAQPSEEKKLKPIEFKHIVGTDMGCPDFLPCGKNPFEWENIELISDGAGDEYDIMFAYDEDRMKGFLYLGHWNDGVAE